MASLLSALISRIFSAKIASSRRKSSRASASAKSFAADAAVNSATCLRAASSCSRRDTSRAVDDARSSTVDSRDRDRVARLVSRGSVPYAATAAPPGSRFTFTVFLMFLALVAYLSVFSVSSKLVSTGETHATTHVFEFPPSESCRRRVSFESRYGTCVRGVLSAETPPPPRFASSPLSAAMTFPSANSPLLMLMLSWNRDPVALVFLFRSDPARSTRWNLADAYRFDESFVKSVCSMMMVKMACDREESAFIFVPPVVRATQPSSRRRSISSAELVATSRAPATTMAPSARSRMLTRRGLVSGCSKSRTSSLCTSKNAHRTRTSLEPDSNRARASAKTSATTRGMMPRSSSARSALPDPIVYVLPEPVWPYASTVALYPRKHDSTSGETRRSYTSACVAPGPNASSKRNARLSPSTTVLAFGYERHSRARSTRSFATRGRARTATRTARSSTCSETDDATDAEVVGRSVIAGEDRESRVADASAAACPLCAEAASRRGGAGGKAPKSPPSWRSSYVSPISTAALPRRCDTLPVVAPERGGGRSDGPSSRRCRSLLVNENVRANENATAARR